MPMMATSRGLRRAIPRPDRAGPASGLRQLRVDAPPEHGGERHERRGQGGDQDRQDERGRIPRPVIRAARMGVMDDTRYASATHGTLLGGYAFSRLSGS